MIKRKIVVVAMPVYSDVPNTVLLWSRIRKAFLILGSIVICVLIAGFAKKFVQNLIFAKN